MSLEHHSMLHGVASYFGVFIGGVTFTGSLAAYRKLANLYKNEKLNLPMAGQINRPIMVLNAVGLGLTLHNPHTWGTVMLF